MNRRTFVRAGAGVAAGTALSGCLNALGFQTQSAWRNPPLVENRPNAVYYPAIVEGMGMYGMTEAGKYAVGLMYSYPHRFWVVTGQSKNKVVVQSDDSLHLMASVWDPKTGTVLPTEVSAEVTRDGKAIDSRSLWPMLSPTMGFHYGDNLSLDGEGNYTANLTINPVQARTTGALKGRFTNSQTVEMPFEFDTNEVYDLPLRRLGDKAGTRGAPKLMKMQMNGGNSEGIPNGRTPSRDVLPGQVLGEGKSGDGTFVVTVLKKGNRFADGNQPYLAVSPRTPYHRIVLPLMSLSATLTRDNKTVFEKSLQSTVDPALGLHYGTATESIEPGDTLTMSVGAPPQTARHDGYETAFFDMPDVRLAV